MEKKHFGKKSTFGGLGRAFLLTSSLTGIAPLRRGYSGHECYVPIEPYSGNDSSENVFKTSENIDIKEKIPSADKNWVTNANNKHQFLAGLFRAWKISKIGSFQPSILNIRGEWC